MTLFLLLMFDSAAKVFETEKLPLRDPAVETEKLRQAVGDEACSYVPADN